MQAYMLAVRKEKWQAVLVVSAEGVKNVRVSEVETVNVTVARKRK